MLITCRTVTEQHTAAREDTLSPWQRFNYRFHMKLCPLCQAYEKGFSQTIAALADLPKEMPTDEVKRAALARLRGK